MWEIHQYLKKEGISDAGTGIIPGTGLNELLKHIQIIYSIPYSNIPHFPKATVEFHQGNLIFGKKRYLRSGERS